MTLLFGESYDWLTSATLLTRKWTTKGAVGTYTFEAGRTGNCLKLTHSSNNVLIEETKGIGAIDQQRSLRSLLLALFPQVSFSIWN